MEYIGLTVDLNVIYLILTDFEYKELQKGLLTPSDFDCYYIFTKDQWIEFKNKVANH